MNSAGLAKGFAKGCLPELGKNSVRWLADENFNNIILTGILRRNPRHDVTTLLAHAYERVINGKSMPGVIDVGPRVPIAVAIDEILLIETCGKPEEWDSQVRFLPL